jgi:hypothetical protein
MIGRCCRGTTLSFRRHGDMGLDRKMALRSTRYTLYNFGIFYYSKTWTGYFGVTGERNQKGK